LPRITLEPTGLVHVTAAVSDTLPITALTFVGARGTAGRARALESADSGPHPTALKAVTVKVEVLPGVNPLTVAVIAGGNA
jgi:hypothetical protein